MVDLLPMSEQRRIEGSGPQPERQRIDGGEVGETAKLPLTGADTGTDLCKPAAPKKLTPEEQMALYEKELKENDWGHQPC